MKPKLISSITHGRNECGVDIIVETVLPRFKFGLQIKSNQDLLEKNFTKDTKAQITDSRKYNFRGVIVILCGNLRNSEVRSKSRNLVSELNRLTDDYVKVVPSEQAISRVKMLQ
jgi:hypothetical protein